MVGWWTRTCRRTSVTTLQVTNTTDSISFSPSVDAIGTLQPFWIAQLGFTAGLLSNLLDDAASLIAHTGGNIPIMEGKLVALARCFAAIVNALSPHLSFTIGPPMSPQWISAEYTRFVTLLTYLNDTRSSNRWRYHISTALGGKFIATSPSIALTFVNRFCSLPQCACSPSHVWGARFYAQPVTVLQICRPNGGLGSDSTRG